MASKHAVVSTMMDDLSRYIAGAVDRATPASVVHKTKAHLLDTVGAIVSGSRLQPGEQGVAYVRERGAAAQASVLATDFLASTSDAAFANGMMAHADETDDSHKDSRSHLGCSVTPAALALAERHGASGPALLRAIALGYDIGARLLLALNPLKFHQAGHCTHAFAGVFGAASAGAALAGLTAQQTRWALSYAAQQAAGVTSWRRAEDHVEKAFVFAAMPARNGVEAVEMTAAGFTGVNDVFTGAQNFFLTFGRDPRPELLTEGLGQRFEIMNTTLKKWSVGSPIQSVLDGVQTLMEDQGFHASDVAGVEIRMAPIEIDTVDGRDMSSINLQHLVAVLLTDRRLTFASSHEGERMRDAAVQSLRARVVLIPDEARERRKAHSTIVLKDQRKLSHQAGPVRGTPDNPMTDDEVTAKAVDLIGPVLGDKRASQLAVALWKIDEIADVRELRPLWRAA